MRNDLTDITVVIDRSGSMASTKSDAEGGLNTFVEEQKRQPGNGVYSLVQFDTVYEWVHRAMNLKDVPPFTLVPRGSTALLDAVGRAVVETGERLAAMPEADRPGLVVFVIVTDGEENSSREYTKAAVKEMIERQRNVYKWQFTFIGANQDAFAEAGAVGIPMAAALNYSPDNARGAYRATSGNVSRMRAAALAGDTVECAYTPEERDGAK